MKNVLIAAAIFGTAFVSCQNGSKSFSSYTTKDSVAYAIGVDVATNLKRMDSTFNSAVIGSAVKDVFDGKGKMTVEEAYAFLNDWFQVRKPAIDKAEGAAWLEEIKAGNSNIQTTESGLMYEIITPGDEAIKATNDADQVVVKYRGTLRDGKEFDKNDSISFQLNRVIPGWTEGMKLIGKGGKANLWVPSDLGYGPQGGGPIPPNAPLKFEVELIDVIPVPAVEEVQ